MRALISVSDKTGVVELAKELEALGIELISTGGTYKKLAEAGVKAMEISELTGFPECLDGRVKTLHPVVHAGLLAMRSNPEHMKQLKELGIEPIDLVIVNLYPFKATILKDGVTRAEAVENIDIGGPTMLRAAAKNYQDVAVVTDPSDYEKILAELKADGQVSLDTKFYLMQKVFMHTSSYDTMIADYLKKERGDDSLPETLTMTFEKVQELRYGENPHQAAAFYRESSVAPGLLAGYEQLQGKELSYNNIADSDAAWECVRSFEAPACVIIKHANPCGVAVGISSAEAYSKAFQTDSKSAFGGIIAFNREVTGECAELVSRQFAECIIAPSFSKEAVEIFAAKKNLRLLTVALGKAHNDFDFKRVGGGLLVQTPDNQICAEGALRCVTKRQPTSSQIADLMFAWNVARFVKSNTIVYARGGMTLGVGAGQMSRVDSARIAMLKAEEAGLSLEGSVAASDAFFPFRDGLDVVVDAGCTAVIQPGGSIRDDEVIAAADERGIAMVFTGERHFRH